MRCLLLLLLWSSLQLDSTGGLRSNDQVSRLQGSRTGKTRAGCIGLAASVLSSTALLTSMALLAESSRSLMDVWRWRLAGGLEAGVGPPANGHPGCCSTCAESSRTLASRTCSRLMFLGLHGWSPSTEVELHPALMLSKQLLALGAVLLLPPASAAAPPGAARTCATGCT